MWPRVWQCGRGCGSVAAVWQCAGVAVWAAPTQIMRQRRPRLLLLLLLLLVAAAAAAADDARAPTWFIHVSDLHLSRFRPASTRTFAALVHDVLPAVRPARVVVTGDLTDGASPHTARPRAGVG